MKIPRQEEDWRGCWFAHRAFLVCAALGVAIIGTLAVSRTMVACVETLHLRWTLSSDSFAISWHAIRRAQPFVKIVRPLDVHHWRDGTPYLDPQSLDLGKSWDRRKVLDGPLGHVVVARAGETLRTATASLNLWLLPAMYALAVLIVLLGRSHRRKAMATILLGQLLAQIAILMSPQPARIAQEPPAYTSLLGRWVASDPNTAQLPKAYLFQIGWRADAEFADRHLSGLYEQLRYPQGWGLWWQEDGQGREFDMLCVVEYPEPRVVSLRILDTTGRVIGTLARAE